MVEVSLIAQIIVSASATVVAAAAVGIYHRVDTLVENVQKHERTLYGEPDVDAWDGLVNRVANHEDELEERRGDDTEP